MVRRKSLFIFHAGLQQLLYWCLEFLRKYCSRSATKLREFQDGEGAEKYLICDENGQVMVPDEEKETWLSFGENLYKDQKQDSWYYAGTISELADFIL